MKKKKYANGGVVRNYIETPQEAMAENDIAMAKAKYEAEKDPWAMGTNMLGNMLISYAASQSGQAGNIGNALKGANNFSNMMAFGGMVPGMVPINAEGKEVVETPDGQVGELKGPSHEQGGIDMFLPPGTDIFSKRIKGPDGKSMADRKKARERKIKKLEKELKNNPSDKILAKTLEKTKSNFEQQESKDKQKMEFARNMFNGMQIMALGGTVGFPPLDWFFTGNPTKGYKTSVATSEFNTDPKGNSEIDYKAVDDYFKNMPISDNASMDGIGMTDQETSFDAYAEKLNKPYTEQQTKSSLNFDPNTEPTFYSDAKTGDLVIEKGAEDTYADAMNQDNWLNKLFDGGDGTGMTFGDGVGMAGNLISTFGPYLNTLKNRSEDTPNINYFRDFGNDALERMEDAKGYVAGQRDLSLKDLETSRVGSINRNRNSARSVNTQRALDLATDMGVNRQRAAIFQAFAQQMQNIIGQQAGMENVQDQMVMQGEKERDLNDRMDKDNFYTQLAQDISTMGTGLQKTGKDVNAIKTRNVTEKVLNQKYEQYGVNGMTGEIQAKAKEDIETNESNYPTYNINSSNMGTYVKGLGTKWNWKDGKLINISTGEEVKPEDIK